MVSVFVIVATFMLGGVFGFMVFALVFAIGDPDLSQDEITPDDAREAEQVLIEYVLRHDNCRACIFEEECRSVWLCCPASWKKGEEKS